MEQSIYWAENLTNEDLITTLIANPNDGATFEELIRRLRPVILGEAMKYRSQLPFDTDDYLQEGRIVLWKIAARGNFKMGVFKNYYISAIRFHLSNVYRNYVLKNFVCIGGYEDIRGNTFQILVEADYAKQYRIKHREHCHRSYEKKKAAECARLGIPEPQPKPRLTPEEKRERDRARSLAYYHAHADEMNAKARAKRAAARAAKQATK